MNTPDYMIARYGAVLHSMSEETHVVEPCCDMMAMMIGQCNYLLELADTPEEWEQDCRHPEHVELRKDIRDHKCLPEITAQLWETVKGYWWADKFKEAYGL